MRQALLVATRLQCFFFQGLQGGKFPPLGFEFPPQTITNLVCCSDILHIFSPHKSNFPHKTTSLEKPCQATKTHTYIPAVLSGIKAAVMCSGIKAAVMCTQLLSLYPEFPAALPRALYNCCTAAQSLLIYIQTSIYFYKVTTPTCIS